MRFFSTCSVVVFLGFFLINHFQEEPLKKIKNTATVKFKTLPSFVSMARMSRVSQQNLSCPVLGSISSNCLSSTWILVALLKIPITNCCSMPCTAAQQPKLSTATLEAQERGENHRTLTFSHSSPSCWLCCRRTAAAAPPGCPECRHLWPAGKDTGKARKLKHSCKLWTLPPEKEPLCSAWWYKPQICLS